MIFSRVHDVAIPQNTYRLSRDRATTNLLNDLSFEIEPIRTSTSSGTTGGNTTDIYHAFDLRPFNTESTEGRLTFDFSALFNSTTVGRVFVSLQIFTAASLPSNGFPGIGGRVCRRHFLIHQL